MSKSRRCASRIAGLANASVVWRVGEASDVEGEKGPGDSRCRSSQSQRGERSNSTEVVDEGVDVDVDEGEARGRMWIGLKTVRPAMTVVGGQLKKRSVREWWEGREKKNRLGKGERD